jgi:hypothetical protein
MFYEYALDPQLLNNWRDFRYFFENMGISKGRLISRYPKHWKRLVYESLNHCSDMERKRIEEALIRSDGKLLRRHNQWDGNKDWLSNAEEEHTRAPFHAIIARNNPHGNGSVLVGDNLDEQESRWKMNVTCDIPRKAQEMAASVATLLQASREIIFIDPHFGPENVRYRRPLCGFLNAALQNRTIKLVRVEYHLEAKSTNEFFDKECKKLADLLPVGIEIRFMRWRELPGSEKLHDRFILTERGGVQFSVGLDDGNQGEMTNVNILSDELCNSTWNKYLSDFPAFELVDEFSVIGTRAIQQGA